MRLLSYLAVFILALTSLTLSAAENTGRFGNLIAYRLDNGLQVIYRSQPGRLRAGIGLVVDIGLQDFSCEQQAAPHLLEHLFFEGSAQFSANELRQRIRQRAGRANGFTFFEDTFYTIHIHEAHTEFAIRHLFHMLTESEFDEAAYQRAVRAIEAERGISRSYLKTLFDGKKSVLEQTIGRAYKGLPIDCDKKAVPTAVSLESVLALREQYYQPQNMTLIVLSNYDQEKLRDTIENTFGHLSGSGANKPKRVTLAASMAAKEAVIEYRDPANVEADLFMVIPSVGYSHEDSPVVEIIADYLDEELFRVVRHHLGLGYTPKATYRSEAGMGYIHAHVQTTGAWIDRAEASFLAVYQSLKQEGISQQRLAQLLKTKVVSLEREERTTLEHLDRHRKGRFNSDFVNRAASFKAITPQKVQNVLKRYFPDQPTIGVLKPRPAKMALVHIALIMLAAGLAGLGLIRLRRRYYPRKP